MGEFETVCITVEKSPNPSHVYIRLCKHRKNVFFCFYEITSSKNYNAGKDKKKSFFWSKGIFLQHWFHNGISQLTNENFDFKIWWWRVYNSCISTSHKRVYILSCKHSERAYYLSYFLNMYIHIHYFIQCSERLYLSSSGCYDAAFGN